MNQTDFDIIVVGGGHAGVEAAMAVARMGRTAAIITMEIDRLALMSCNPAVGGVGKSHLVKEIDALGGLMGEAADATGIQFRRLNLSRGPAVWSTRVQCDRVAYNQYVLNAVRRQPNITLVEGLAGEFLVENKRIVGIKTEAGEILSSRAVIVATGTFLGGMIHIGERKIRAGRIGEDASWKLSESFRKLGFELGRLKTGTPPRLDGNTIDWSKCDIQPGQNPIPFFANRSDRPPFDQAVCHLTRTTDATRKIVTTHKSLSPIFSGQITSSGPRYCPSIEAKYQRFSDKATHHIFLEPEGTGTNEIYPNGFSTALPEEVQVEAIRTIIGLEEVKITLPGYAVEYDYVPTHQVKPSLETRKIGGLFLAGQINGTSGYEEAAALGLVAGINAVLMLEDEPPFVPDRSESYLGVMLDDLATRAITEPYRMFTSRAEYRLALREDNARDRMHRYAVQYGLISEHEQESFSRLENQTRRAVENLGRTRIKTSELGEFSQRFQKAESVSMSDLLKQPRFDLSDLSPILERTDPELLEHVEALERAAIQIRYEGYIAKQAREVAKHLKMESEQIPEGFDYSGLTGLKTEAMEKLAHHRPRSLGQAGRVSGVTAGDIAVLAVYLKKYKSL